MGLDTVELVMEIEKEFDIKVSDQDAQKLETVGSVYDYLRRRLGVRPGARCVTRSIFFRLRNVLERQFDVPRRLVRPATALDRLLSPALWRRLRSDIERSTSLALPLVRPRVQHEVIRSAGLLLVVAGLVVPFLFIESTLLAGTVALGAAVVASVAAGWSTSPCVVTSTASFRDFVETVSMLNDVGERELRWTDETVWLTLKRIVVEQLGVRPEEVTPEAHFIRDLGAD